MAESIWMLFPQKETDRGAEDQSFATKLLTRIRMRFLVTGRRQRRVYMFLVLISVGSLLILLMSSGTRNSKVVRPSVAKEKAISRGDPPALVVHLDLKGSPPTMPFLRSFLQLIAAEGADGLLLEYEDTFPFEGTLASLAAPHAFTKGQVLQVLEWAAELRLQVIPLVQTFGHLEYVLKLPEFRHLSETHGNISTLCPMHPNSMVLVEEMLLQVMRLHLRATPPARFLHIGCDEVILGKCRRCKSSNISSTDLFVDHVTRVARLVRSQFLGVTPLIWDDMLRPMDHHELVEAARQLATLAEPVVWVYDHAIEPLVTPSLWYTYGSQFGRVWGAAAYRGASGPTAPAPNLAERLRNVAAWRRRQLGPPGEPRPAPASLVLTGWARYDHFQVLCELLPVAVPSLVLTLLMAREEDLRKTQWLMPEKHAGKLLASWRLRMRCPPRATPWPALDLSPSQWDLADCSFLGSDAFAAVAQCERALNATAAALHQPAPSAPWNYLQAAREPAPAPTPPPPAEVRRLSAALDACRAALVAALPRYMHAAAVREWLEERVEPARRLLERLRPGPGRAARLPDGDVRHLGLQRRWWPPEP